MRGRLGEVGGEVLIKENEKRSKMFPKERGR
jgi:hypothetical protein